MLDPLRKIIIATLPLAVTAILISGCTGPDGSPEEGARWFTMHNCSACHGTTANNGKAAEIGHARKDQAGTHEYC